MLSSTIINCKSNITIFLSIHKFNICKTTLYQSNYHVRITCHPPGTGSKMLPLFDSESFPNKCRRSELSTCSTKSISATVLYILELSTSVLNSKAIWTIIVFSLMRLTRHVCSSFTDIDISHILTSYSFNIVHYCTILSATSMISEIYFWNKILNKLIA